ncbi:hypothetical protein M8J77_003356 [Diaphorina citri]|nr:hypothetical protein M8J77_003356 [Diaphorina citri]
MWRNKRKEKNKRKEEKKRNKRKEEKKKNKRKEEKKKERNKRKEEKKKEEKKKKRKEEKKKILKRWLLTMSFSMDEFRRPLSNLGVSGGARSSLGDELGLLEPLASPDMVLNVLRNAAPKAKHYCQQTPC